ncbi:hypothetical protein CGRA01v4_12711 [Colletotrichum graminicola]|nr:hypothetical protein CGRA01v4_12711 [Colletotrichum graminicola]
MIGQRLKCTKESRSPFSPRVIDCEGAGTTHVCNWCLVHIAFTVARFVRQIHLIHSGLVHTPFILAGATRKVSWSAKRRPESKVRRNGTLRASSKCTGLSGSSEVVTFDASTAHLDNHCPCIYVLSELNHTPGALPWLTGSAAPGGDTCSAVITGLYGVQSRRHELGLFCLQNLKRPTPSSVIGPY